MIYNKQKLSHRFTLPNELFCLDLSHGAIAVYAYLLYIEDRKSYSCHPSYSTIGDSVRMSPNTVRKYVSELVDKRLIRTENTTLWTKDGLKRNANLKYIILPIQEAVEYYHQSQLERRGLPA